MSKQIEENTKTCVACMASGTNLKYHLPKHETGRIKKNLTEPGKKFHIDFSENWNNKKVNWENQTFFRNLEI